ncbi:hypothetical protein AMECASPLE_037837 [Ameca splendens]|uniref:Uncharacterized protein n=1 Tax=Ameca splendens TaxID=208324 RepID=A0ABV1AFW6_9TELE
MLSSLGQRGRERRGESFHVSADNSGKQSVFVLCGLFGRKVEKKKCDGLSLVDCNKKNKEEKLRLLENSVVFLLRVKSTPTIGKVETYKPSYSCKLNSLSFLLANVENE